MVHPVDTEVVVRKGHWVYIELEGTRVRKERTGRASEPGVIRRQINKKSLGRNANRHLVTIEWDRPLLVEP